MEEVTASSASDSVADNDNAPTNSSNSSSSSSSRNKAFANDKGRSSKAGTGPAFGEEGVGEKASDEVEPYFSESETEERDRYRESVMLMTAATTAAKTGEKTEENDDEEEDIRFGSSDYETDTGNDSGDDEESKHDAEGVDNITLTEKLSKPARLSGFGLNNRKHSMKRHGRHALDADPDADSDVDDDENDNDDEDDDERDGVGDDDGPTLEDAVMRKAEMRPEDANLSLVEVQVKMAKEQVLSAMTKLMQQEHDRMQKASPSKHSSKHHHDRGQKVATAAAPLSYPLQATVEAQDIEVEYSFDLAGQFGPSEISVNFAVIPYARLPVAPSGISGVGALSFSSSDDGCLTKATSLADVFRARAGDVGSAAAAAVPLGSTQTAPSTSTSSTTISSSTTSSTIVEALSACELPLNLMIAGAEVHPKSLSIRHGRAKIRIPLSITLFSEQEQDERASSFTTATSSSSAAQHSLSEHHNSTATTDMTATSSYNTNNSPSNPASTTSAASSPQRRVFLDRREFACVSWLQHKSSRVVLAVAWAPIVLGI